MTVLLWVFGGVAAFVALIAVLAAFPVRLRLTGDTQATPMVTGELALFGGLGPAVRLATGEAAARAPSPEADRDPKPRKRHRRPTARQVARFAAALPRLLADLAGTVRVDRLDLDTAFGLGDPAETGELYGRLTPLLYGFGWSRRVTLRPDFTCARFEMQGAADLSLRPIALVPPAARFLWSGLGGQR